MNTKLNIALIFALFLGPTNCSNLVQVKIDVVDQRTALENQVLGSYERIEGEVMLLASVRSVDSSGKIVKRPKISEGRKKVIRAMQRSRFNEDDIKRFKKTGAIGEGKDGFLSHFDKSKVLGGKENRFAQELVRQENEDRKILYQRIVDTNEAFSESDMKVVQTVMAGLNRDSAQTGERVQTDSGQWIQKPGK